MFQKVFFKNFAKLFSIYRKWTFITMSKMENLKKLLSKKSEKNYCTTKL